MDFVKAALEFLESIWSFVLALFEFLTDFLSSINKVFDFIVSFIFKLPTLLLNIFSYLPDFMKDGLYIVIVSIVFVLVIKIILLFKNTTTKS